MAVIPIVDTTKDKNYYLKKIILLFLLQNTKDLTKTIFFMSF